jgi:hypothetical protein
VDINWWKKAKALFGVFTFYLVYGHATVCFAGNANFSTIARNITTSISLLPGLLTAISYLMGLVLGVLGVLKIKDHVENPLQTPLHHGAIRLLVGGALFSLSIIFEAMHNTMGVAGVAVQAAPMNSASFNVS